MLSAATPPQTAFPLGQPILQVLAVPGPADAGVSCSLHDAQGFQLGLIRPRTRVPAVIGRETGTLLFDLLRPTGAIALTFIRIGGAARQHELQVQGGDGTPIGRLRQTSSYWRLFRTPRLDMSLETGLHVLGSTEVCVRPNDPFAVIETPIRDAQGEVVSTVERQWHYADSSTDMFDYTLYCPRPLVAPLPDLLVATAFAHYLYDRLAVGGPLEAVNRFGTGPGRW